MALILDSNLAAVQSSVYRNPIIEVIAGRISSNYPFEGASIANSEETIQGLSSSVFLSNGALAIVYAGYNTGSLNGDLKQLRIILSDTNVTEFLPYIVIDSDTRQITSIKTVSLFGGEIGIVVQWGIDLISVYRLSQAGVKLSEIQVTGLSTITGISITKTTTNYVIVYSRVVSSVYSIYYITSNDLITLSNSAIIYIPGIINTNEIKDINIFYTLAGQFLLTFSYTENTITGVYSSISSTLLSWSGVESVFTTTDINVDYVSSVITQQSNGTLTVAASKVSTYLELKTSSTGWNTSDKLDPTYLKFDSSNNFLYLVSDPYGLKGICRIDTSTWEIDKFYGYSTVPAVPLAAGAFTYNAQYSFAKDGLVAVFNQTNNCISVIDFNNDRITTYYFADLSSTYGSSAARNVNHNLYTEVFSSSSMGGLCTVAIYDNKLYTASYWGYFLASNRLAIGYIDLTDNTPNYDFVDCGVFTDLIGASIPPKVLIYPEYELCLVCGPTPYSIPNQSTNALLTSLSDKSLLKNYIIDSYVDFPKGGISDGCIVGGRYIYGLPVYTSEVASESYKWGLVEIDTLTDTINYYYPSWITSPGNYYSKIEKSEQSNEVLLRSAGGVSIFNYSSKTWERDENLNLTGLPPSGSSFGSTGLAYDHSNRFFFYGNEGFVYLVPRGGELSSIVYKTKDATSWSAEKLLVTGYYNRNPELSVSNNDEIYATWSNNKNISTIYWDKSGAVKDLISFLTDEIKLQWSLEDAGQVSFTVSNGHLFDPRNTNSLLRPYLLKGKKVSVRMGEKINGVNYLVKQGTYTITSQELFLQRGTYPVMKITAQDDKYLWGLHTLTAVSVDNLSPSAAIKNIVSDYLDIPEEDTTIPSMPLGFNFSNQWLDKTLLDILQDIAHRFQYFIIINMDGKIETRPISFSSSSGLTVGTDSIISFKPNDDSSDLTTTITVTGESLDSFESVYAEEQITSKNGTVGWWGFKKDFKICYSDDLSTTYKDPRLLVKESASSILFKLAGKVKESITYIDPDNKYCTVTVTAPNLIPVLVSAIALYAVGNSLGDGVVSVGAGMTTPIGRKIEGVALLLALSVLGSTGNYQYEIYGRPVGYVKRSYQATSYDNELASSVGNISKKVEGFLCFTPADCQTVADFEMQIAKAERNKITVEMVTNLMTEVGDTVSFIHPYTKLGIKSFITRIERVYRAGTEGYCKDTVEGWVL